jgi:superfamily II DNA/RNA helicase
VKPRTFVINVGVQEALKKVRRVASDFDMNAVAEIMDKSPVTDAVISHWKEKACGRQTVVFCSTVEHAQNVADAFSAAGVTAALVHGDMKDADRRPRHSGSICKVAAARHPATASYGCATAP